MYKLFYTSESRKEPLRNLIPKKNLDKLRVERSQNETLVTLLMENRKIALMGCIPSSGTITTGTTVVFSEILQSLGENILSNIRSTGKFKLIIVYIIFTLLKVVYSLYLYNILAV